MNPNQEQKIIKVILPGMCPHCNKEVLMALRTVTPVVDWVLKKEDIQTAKDKAVEAITNSDIDADEKLMALKWVQNEETLFGPDEVEHVLAQILQKNEEDTNTNKDE